MPEITCELINHTDFTLQINNWVLISLFLYWFIKSIRIDDTDYKGFIYSGNDYLISVQFSFCTSHLILSATPVPMAKSLIYELKVSTNSTHIQNNLRTSLGSLSAEKKNVTYLTSITESVYSNYFLMLMLWFIIVVSFCLLPMTLSSIIYLRFLRMTWKSLPEVLVLML